MFVSLTMVSSLHLKKLSIKLYDSQENENGEESEEQPGGCCWVGSSDILFTFQENSAFSSQCLTQ